MMSLESEDTKMSNLQVANTILEQLGGRRLMAMTGAKNFIGSEDALSFRLPSNFAKDGINAVRVQLMADDTYTVCFSKVRGTAVKVVSIDHMVYCDMLQDLFMSKTGLATRLGCQAPRVQRKR
jgi:hypothetical protein